MVTVHAFVCKYQEDSDLLFTLYDADEMRALTENYVVKWGRQGLARDLDQFDNHRVLFTVSAFFAFVCKIVGNNNKNFILAGLEQP